MREITIENNRINSLVLAFMLLDFLKDTHHENGTVSPPMFLKVP